MHPCAYDAYGMTLVEAAAFGCPSLVNGGGAVGATELLGADGCVQVGPAYWKVALVVPQLGTAPGLLGRIRRPVLGCSTHSRGAPQPLRSR